MSQQPEKIASDQIWKKNCSVASHPFSPSSQDINLRRNLRWLFVNKHLYSARRRNVNPSKKLKKCNLMKFTSSHCWTQSSKTWTKRRTLSGLSVRTLLDRHRSDKIDRHLRHNRKLKNCRWLSIESKHRFTSNKVRLAVIHIRSREAGASHMKRVTRFVSGRSTYKPVCMVPILTLSWWARELPRPGL